MKRNLLQLGLLITMILLTGTAHGSQKKASQKITKKNSQTADSVLILENGQLVDGNGGPVISNVTVVVKNGRIDSVITDPSVKSALPGKRIDLNGATIMPGLINAHIHDGYKLENLERWLKAGVTTVRDLGPQSDRNFIRDRDLLNQGGRGAFLVSATPIISVQGGYYEPLITSKRNAKKVVSDFVKAGVDIIKTSVEDDCQGLSWVLIPPSELKLLCETAHEYKKRVSVHITHARNLQVAIDCGVDEIAHMVVEPVHDSVLNAIVGKNIYWIPTLELWKGISGMYPNNYLNEALDNLSRFYKAGGKIALGTDFAGFETEFDKGLPETEIDLMSKAGLSNMDIIIAATKNAAFVCDLGAEIGTIEKGKRADVLIVDGNPVEDIKVLSKVKMVLKNGQIVE